MTVVITIIADSDDVEAIKYALVSASDQGEIVEAFDVHIAEI